MEPDERQRFGEYLRQLREKRNLSLRDVEKAVKDVRLSNSYLYQIERGDRNPPRVEILRELARVYQVPFGTLMNATGYEDAPRTDLYQNQINRAFEYVRNDSSFRYGMQAQGDTLTNEAKRFIIELYERAHPGIKLLADQPAAPEVGNDDEEVEEDD